jgi:thymidine kinase
MLVQTRNGKLITLNEGQEEAIHRMNEWLNRSDKLWFCLEGPAGSGKSTIINELFNMNSRIKVFVSAPTHKAKFVVRKTTGKEDFTIQKLLGLRPNIMLEDFDRNNMRFERDEANSKIKECALLCIDEASMLNRSLLSYVKEVSEEYRVKVLFVGDRHQIPPVKEPKSLVFFDDEITKFYLTKVERQVGGSPIIEVCDYLRTLGDKFPEFGSKLFDKANQFGSVNYYNAKAPGRFGQSLIQAFKDDKIGTKLLCYTIRDTTEIISYGDVLMSYTNESDCAIVQGHNSSDYEVVTVDKKEVTSIFGKKFKCLVVKLKEIDTGFTGTVNFIHPDDYESFLKEDTRLISLAENSSLFNRAQNWKNYSAWKKQFLIMHDLQRKGRVKGEKNAILTKDFDYGYCMTTHKAQGSTYNKIFVNWPDMRTNRKVLERNQLLYVACSRPTQELHILY